MALVKGSTYENVYFEFVLDGVRDILQAEFTGLTCYISPTMKEHKNFAIKLWGPSATTTEEIQTQWGKTYEVSVDMYAIEKNPGEAFYKQFYGDSERIYQSLFNNHSKSITVGSTTLVWIDGSVSEIVIGELSDEEEEIDGLHKATLSFSCIMRRAD